jgi:hypothetical protein
LLDDRKHNDKRIYFDYQQFLMVMIDDESLQYFCLTEILTVQLIPDDQRDSEFVHEYDNYRTKIIISKKNICFVFTDYIHSH